MNPIIITAANDSTTKIYQVDKDVWLKVTSADNFEYAWFIGPTWDEAAPGSPCAEAPLIAKYSKNKYDLVWARHGVGLHRENGPARISCAGENMTAEWYQNGQRAPSPTAGALALMLDPLGKEIRADILERLQTTEFCPVRQWGQLFMAAADTSEHTDSESESDFTDCTIDTTGAITFGKLHEFILAKYLLLTSTDPDSKPAEELLDYYCKIKQVEQNICDSGIVSAENILARDFRTIYNIYIAKIAAAGKISDILPAIESRKEIIRLFYAHGVDSPDAFLQ